jgi:hypothetical protein
MSDIAGARPARTPAYWAGWALSGLVIAFVVMDATMKLLAMSFVTEASIGLGYPGTAGFARELGVILSVCIFLYATPRTAVLGAILLTAYLGGAVASHLRLGHPLFSHVLFGVYLGVMAWGGLWLRDPRVRALLPVR